jgi:UDP-N-acetylglucosamine 2-epimerase (non-hydrolysing)
MTGHLIEPINYSYLIWLMSKSYFVMTDSGEIQEEAPSLGNPVLVMRDVTERTEGIAAGTAKLVGTSKDTIVSNVERLLKNKAEYNKMAKSVNPNGDGKTSVRIVEILSTL